MPAWVRPYVIGLLSAAFVIGVVLLVTRPSRDAVEVLIATPAATTIAVAISGEVARPGVYYLPPGSRVADLIGLAGGATERADPSVPSRALLLRDEMHVHVAAAPSPGSSAAALTRPSDEGAPAASPVGATVPPPASAAAGPVDPRPQAMPAATPTPGATRPEPPTAATPINLNSASAAELERLPGIGAALAGRIVADRERNGPFQRVDDLDRVQGIGAILLARLRPLVTV